MSELAKWSPPKLSTVGKFPTVDIRGDVNEYIQWFFLGGINPFIPPIYREFVILFDSTGGKCTVYVEYLNMAQFRLCFYRGDKKKFFVSVDYDKASGNEWEFDFHNCSNDASNERTSMIIIRLVLAVQAYILYHKPDVVPILIIDGGEKKPPKKSAAKSVSAEPDRKIKKQVKKYIRLDAEDSKIMRDKSPRNYRAIQWQVRGFYRRQNYKGGKTKMIYIAPHSAKRGEKKIKNIKIIVE